MNEYQQQLEQLRKMREQNLINESDYQIVREQLLLALNLDSGLTMQTETFEESEQSIEVLTNAITDTYVSNESLESVKVDSKIDVAIQPSPKWQIEPTSDGSRPKKALSNDGLAAEVYVVNGRLSTEKQRILMMVEHVNLQKILDIEVFESINCTYLYLQPIQGKSVAEILEQRPQNVVLPWEKMKGVCSQIAQGIESLHSENLRIKNLDPTNILLMSSRKVVICRWFEQFVTLEHWDFHNERHHDLQELAWVIVQLLTGRNQKEQSIVEFLAEPAVVQNPKSLEAQYHAIFHRLWKSFQQSNSEKEIETISELFEALNAVQEFDENHASNQHFNSNSLDSESNSLPNQPFWPKMLIWLLLPIFGLILWWLNQ